MLENATKLAENLRRPFLYLSSGDRLKKVFEDLFFGDRLKKNFEDFFGRTIAPVSLVFGLEHFCPWLREGLSSEGLFLALTSDFFCVLGLGLEPCVLDCTSDFYCIGLNMPL